jgi:ribonucleoside-diphosphate reductase alpha chain
MGQSLNLYFAEKDGRKLSEMYMYAWRKGLKTTYYLRSLGATQIEKSTMDINRRGVQPRWMKNRSASSNIVVDREHRGEELGDAAPVPKACSITDPDCEACQ